MSLIRDNVPKNGASKGPVLLTTPKQTENSSKNIRQKYIFDLKIITIILVLLLKIENQIFSEKNHEKLNILPNFLPRT